MSTTNIKLSLETIGHHNALVAYSGDGSKIILLEDSPFSGAKERAAYSLLAPFVQANGEMKLALELEIKARNERAAEREALIAAAQALQNFKDLSEDPAGSTCTLKRLFGTFQHGLGKPEIEGALALKALTALDAIRNQK